MSADSDESEFLIQYFSNLILTTDNQKLQLMYNEHYSQVLYVFIHTNKKFDYKTWGQEYFGKQVKITMFKKSSKYTILKLLSDQGRLFFQNFKHQEMACCIKPTFHISATLQSSSNFEQLNEYSVSVGQKCIYLLGKELKQQENELMEYKSYKAELLINNTGYQFYQVLEQVLKVICGMLNSGKEGQILIGISFDKDLNGNVVSGCFCQEKKAQQIIVAINDKCKQLGCDQLVNVKQHECGVILNESCYVVSNLKMYLSLINRFEIKINGGLNKLITFTPGKYYIRQHGHCQPIKMKQLFTYWKQEMITEEQFEQCLNYYDELMKKNKLI